MIHPTRFTRFGYKFLDKVKGSEVFHPGVDYNAPQDFGQPVWSVGDGIVRYVDNEGYNRGWGSHIWVEHSETLWSHYGHLIEGSITVTENEPVTEGQTFARLGNTGNSSGAHLHCELMKHKPAYWTTYPNGKSKEWVERNYYNPLTYLTKPMTPEEKLARLKELSDETHDVRLKQKELELEEDRIRAQVIEILATI